MGNLPGMYLGFADTQPADAVTVNLKDLQPKGSYVQTTLTAVHDIQFCEELFDEWLTELNKTNNSTGPDKRVQELTLYLMSLKEDVGHCSNKTNEILRCQVQFASLMAQRIDDLPRSRYNLESDGSETTRLAEKISEKADLLGSYVTKMRDDLQSFVAALEELQVKVKRERSLLEQIWAWLKSLFNAIASFFATICSPISSLLLRSTNPIVRESVCALSTLRKAAAMFFTVDSETQKGRELESFDSVILFLKKIVPRQAQIAQKKLGQFDGALDMMRLESQIREGRRVTVSGRDTAAVSRKWRDVAEQYRSVLPDNEKKSY